ncbi:neurobeachin-like protein 1 isoform X2 [Pomacea canaliculata]|uniref:neurobeachin-like protein 1 isoform X2 n=1 Tax=Pomacea canaliculata TaxID=400727 RepID=UPI000D732D00|nr:neurobeachin-like protein 1 isoform X2 [Pomacea canaliculata]
MEGLNTGDKLFQLWMMYVAKHDIGKLKQFIQLFIENYKEFIDCDFRHLSEGFSEEGPHLTRLPDGILEALNGQLSNCSDKIAISQCFAGSGAGENGDTGSEDNIQLVLLAEKILQCLIVLCRNHDNVHLVASCEFVSYLVAIATPVVEQLCIPSSGSWSRADDYYVSFLKHALHLFECLYDPYFVWRKRLQGWNVDKTRQRFRPANLHNEVVPFFHECFQKTGLSSDIQLRLLHVFGAIMCGSQTNARKAVTPATLDVLLKVLSNETVKGPTNSQRQELAALKDIALKCTVRMVHVIHECSPDQRQIEVNEVMHGYMQVLLALDLELSAEVDTNMQLTMINMINEMVACNDKSSLQVLLVSGGTFNSFVSLLQKTTLTGVDAQKLAMAVVRVMQAVLSGSGNAKALFREKVSYQWFIEALKSLGQPSTELLKTLLDLVVEDTYESGNKMQVCNTEAAIMLLRWLPDIQSRELQVWLAEQLASLCCQGHRSRMSCCSSGMISHIIMVLGRQKQIDHKAVGHLISLVESLGALSMPAKELKQLISLFRLDEEGKQMPYTTRLMRAISTMARREGKEMALNFFDLQKPADGISLPAIRKWSGPGFSFHAWICLDVEIDLRSHNLYEYQTFRRQLYTFNDGFNNGLEAFITPNYDLVVAVYNKKEYCTLTVTDTRLHDGLWHSVGVVHIAARRPFSQSQVQVYIDGRQKAIAPFKFPNLSEHFSTCRIGSPGPHYSTDVQTETYGDLPGDLRRSPFKRIFGGQAKTVTPAPAVGVTLLSAGSQDDYWGPPITLHGRVSAVCVFSDVVQPAQFLALNSSGPNDITVFKDDSDLADLQTKLVARYSAKACKDHVCADLSPYQNHGQFSGEKCVAWDIKDTINCIGGVQVLFPLLEHVDPEAPIPTPAATPVSTSNSIHNLTEYGNEWVVVASSSYADSKLEQNQVAAFLTLLRHLLQTKPVNQDTFIRTQGAATIGALLQKVSPELIDVNVLMAVQLLTEASVATNKILTHHLYQYILFDFRVWSKSAFPVRIGHIQYLSTIIKDDRKTFRKKYGVQYFLDIIREYYSSTDDSGLSEEDSKTIRVSLFNLIKYYIIRDITADELGQLLGFLLAVKTQDLVLEGLDLLLSLLECRDRRYDQLYLLLFEPEQAETLYKLLTYHGYPIIFYEKVVKVLWLMLKSDRAYDRSKQRLRLSDVGHGGLVSMMGGYDISVPMIKRFVEQVSYGDSPQSYNSILAVLSLIHGSGLDIKLEASRQLLNILVSKPAAAKHFAKQLAWQDIFIRLLISGPLEEDMAKANSANHACATDHSESMNDSSMSIMFKEEQLQTVSTPNPIHPCRPHLLNLSNIEDSFLDPPPLQTPSTPMFMQQQLNELNVSEEERSQSASRSSSASIEDLSAIGQRASNNRLQSLSSSQSFSEGLIPTSESIGDISAFGDIDSRRASSVLPTENFRETLDQLGFHGSYKRDAMEQTEELCQNMLIILLSTLWKGLDGSDKATWRERGQVFVCLEKVSGTHRLVRPCLEIKRRLLEMMLHSCTSDIRDSAQPLATHTENAIELVRMVWSFITKEATFFSYAFSERLLEDLMSLLDVLGVWDTEAGHGWTEMIHLGFSILLAFSSQPNLELCAAATAKLHSLVQTKLISSSAEASFILGSLHDMIMKTVKENGDNYAFLMPVLKALMDKAHALLTIEHLLPNLPQTTRSPTFFDDFHTYCKTEEWNNFMLNYIRPQYDHFVESHFGHTSISMESYWNECREQVELAFHRRNREIGESKLKLQSQVFDAVAAKVSHENRRFQNLLTQQKNQHLSSLRQWHAVKAFFASDRGSWKEGQTEEFHWKLSNQENFSRMKVKLIPNYNFDPHLDASRLRDNMGEPSEGDAIEAEKIRVSKEALVSRENIADDALGDEEWSVISASSAASEEYTGKEKLVISEDVELVTLVNIIKGRLEVTSTHVYFFDCSLNKEEGGEDFKWALSQLREIHFRRYNLRRSAIEVFLVDQTNYFINFPRKHMRNKVYSRILSLRPPNLIYYGTRSPAELLKASGLTQKWVQREISNFDYLMQLNTIAGRTYNDLSQYPVFPWILRDYTSEVLDLDDPKVFRNLCKPMGVVNPKNEEEVREKYDTFEDPTGTIEKFHYGTHYSNAAGVMHYMVRMEPFTTLHIQLQSGKFDVADRQFHSVPGSWSSLMENPNDVKELIPEFFYLPEFLVNSDGFDLGKLQITKDPVSDVILPKWAKTAEEFIYKHRQALESDFVSNNLNHWIDLIFGYKQKGLAAEEALNVFYYVTYEGAVDLDAIQDPKERASLEGMINNFGQTPTQLLKEPHPKRMSFEEAVARSNKMGRPMSIFNFLSDLKPFFVEVSSPVDPVVFVNVPRNQTRSILQKGMPDSMITVTEDGIIGVHGWLPFDKNIINYYTFEKDATVLSQKSKKRIGGPFAPGLKMEPKLFAVTHDARLLLSGGYWDNSLQVYRLDKAMTVNHIVRHIDIVTCLALDHCGRHLITGSRDTTCMVWEIQHQHGFSSNIDARSVITLYGHDKEVTAVHISVELDLAVSASKDGTVIVHTVRKGHYMRTLQPSCDPSSILDIPLLVVSDVGQIILYCVETNTLGKIEKHVLHEYSINGKFLCSRRVVAGVGHMVISGDHLVLGDTDGQLTIFHLFALKPLAALQLLVPIQCLTITNGNSHILVGLHDGKLIIVGVKGKIESS